MPRPAQVSSPAGSMVRLKDDHRAIDARCALDGEYWHSAGWTFRILGRP